MIESRTFPNPVFIIAYAYPVCPHCLQEDRDVEQKPYVTSGYVDYWILRANGDEEAVVIHGDFDKAWLAPGDVHLTREEADAALTKVLAEKEAEESS
jgi:hypothetical protein